MFVKPKQEPQAVKAARPKVKLTNAEKREIRRIIENAKGDGKARTAQDTLPFRQMYPDGLCRLDKKTWSRCIEFEDVNYQLAKPTIRRQSLKLSVICITPTTLQSAWSSPL